MKNIGFIFGFLAIGLELAGCAEQGACSEEFAVAGRGRAALRRWSFNPLLVQCETFLYRGKGGSRNNFDDEEVCNFVCGGTAKPSKDRAPSPTINCGCQCSNLIYKDEDGKVHGNCRSTDDTGAQWCYAEAGSTCQDIQTKTTVHDEPWSYEACATPARPTTTPTGCCRADWAGPAAGDLGGEMQGQEACVKVLQNNGKHYSSRATCRQECLNLGGDLVSIHSDRENRLVHGLINAGQDVRPAWIGVSVCNDSSGCNDFSWTDETPVPYANFTSGPPYSPGSCYAMGVTANGADPQMWVAVPCDGVDRYDCVCLEILG